jgi:hypothetical protein
MKGVTAYVAAAVVLTVLGGICLAGGFVDRQIVRTQEHFVALKYGESAEAFDTVERYLKYGSWIPWIGRQVNDVRTRRAAMYYWQRQYDRIVPQQADPLTGIPEASVNLQLIAANAAYRKSQPAAKDRTSTLRALDAAVNAYFVVLKNAGGNEAAAYNYEYIVRLREDVDKGRRAANLTDTAEDGPAGRQGGPPPQGSKPEFKILIPLEPGEMDKATEPGRGTPIERKG